MDYVYPLSIAMLNYERVSENIGVGQNLRIIINLCWDEHPFTSYFGDHQGTRHQGFEWF